MPMIREFQGKIVKRTLCVGDMVAVVFDSRVKGKPGERALLPVAEYRAGLKSRFEPDSEADPRRNGKQPWANGCDHQKCKKPPIAPGRNRRP